MAFLGRCLRNRHRGQSKSRVSPRHGRGDRSGDARKSRVLRSTSLINQRAEDHFARFFFENQRISGELPRFSLIIVLMFRTRRSHGQTLDSKETRIRSRRCIRRRLLQHRQFSLSRIFSFNGWNQSLLDWIRHAVRAHMGRDHRPAHGFHFGSDEIAVRKASRLFDLRIAARSCVDVLIVLPLRI